MELLWRELARPHRRWIYLNALLATAAINVVVNAGLAWLSAGGEATVPLLSVPLVEPPSTIVDTIGTLFLLPLITSVLASAAVRRDRRAGVLPPLPGRPPLARALVARLPSSPLRRGVALGALCVVALGPPAVAALVATDFAGLSRTQFAVYKALLAVTLGALVTPVIAVRAMLA